MKVVYSSNNSGGSWWLNDADWKALEANGWTVDWYNKDHIVFSEPNAKGENRFLDALATKATIEANSVEDAIEKWTTIIGQDAESEGCSCCGEPHYFCEEYL